MHTFSDFVKTIMIIVLFLCLFLHAGKQRIHIQELGQIIIHPAADILFGLLPYHGQ